MSCFSSQEFSKMIPLLSKSKTMVLENIIDEDCENDNIIKLLRGGCIIKTIIGNIQFGMPPETVKDALNMQLDVPLYYIVPTDRFNRKYGLNVAEFEFPAYYNFFVRKKRINLICTKEAEIAIRIIFQETLLGPESYETLSEDFYYSYDKDGYPDFQKELGFFSKNPSNPSERLKIDTLLEFTLFDEQTGIATLEKGLIRIQKNERSYTVIEGNKEIATINDEVDLDLPSSLMIKLPQVGLTTLFSAKNDMVKKSKKKSTLRSSSFMEFLLHDEDFEKKQFVPPEFGVTVLGCSHGFDPKGSTSGYVFWVNGRGIMVDPPPFSTYLLKKIGISSVLIEAIILSHCHADHDSGVFQKILDYNRVEMITTRTIMNSFLRKYSALSGVSVNQLSELFIFKPAIIGAPVPLFGAHFNFFYAFHPIPSLGFEVFYKNKSIYFSSDHFYEPETLLKLKINGILKNKRYEQLVDVKFDHDLILHEAGVPPIHTPQTVLANLPEKVKSKLYLVHVADSEILPDRGLQAARAGIENTFRLIEDEGNKTELSKKLEIISAMDIFENMNLKNLREFLNVLKEEKFEAGEYIINEGEKGFKFYIMVRGVAKIFSNSINKKFSRYVSVGDYFGESAIIEEDMTRKASVLAMSQTILLSIERHEFQFIFGYNLGANCSPVVENLLRLSDSRKTDAITLIFKNNVFCEMKPAQKTQLEMLFKDLINYKAFDVVWDTEHISDYALIIHTGSFELYKEGTSSPEICEPGWYIGEVSSMIKQEKFKTNLTCIEDGSAYKLNKTEFLKFLQKNPGLMFYFSSIDFCF